MNAVERGHGSKDAWGGLRWVVRRRLATEMTCTDADKNGCTMAKGGDGKETKVAAPGAKVGDKMNCDDKGTCTKQRAHDCACRVSPPVGAVSGSLHDTIFHGRERPCPPKLRRSTSKRLNSMGTPRVMTRKPPNTIRWAMDEKAKHHAQIARGQHAQAMDHASAASKSHTEHYGK